MVTTMVIGFLTGIIVAFFGVHTRSSVTLGTMTLVKGISVLTTRRHRYRRFSSRNPVPRERQAVWNTSINDSFPLCATVVACAFDPRPVWSLVRLIGFERQGHSLLGRSHRRMDAGWLYVVSSLLWLGGRLVMMARFNSASAGYRRIISPGTILAAVLGGVRPL